MYKYPETIELYMSVDEPHHLMAVMELEREELELAANRIEIAKTLLTRRSAAKVQEADRGE